MNVSRVTASGCAFSLQTRGRLIQVAMNHAASTQVVWSALGDEYVEFALPSADNEVRPGVPWGHADEFCTPAFWKMQASLQQRLNRYQAHQLGSDLLEEVAACLLGGYGIPAGLGLAAFERLRIRGLLDGYASASTIESALEMPFLFGGTRRMYRFARKKAAYIAVALSELRGLQAYRSDRDLRSILLSFPGIGPKTASWVVRNHLNSDRVAILDIHVVRACVAMGLFPAWANPAKNYYELEELFLEFCSEIGEPAATVDALMWDYMRRIGPTARASSLNR